MKKIGIDARLAHQTGVGRYITNLIRYLPETKKYQWHLYVLPETNRQLVRQANCVIRPAPYRWHSFAEQTAFLHQLNQDQLDLMHFTYFSYPLFYRKKFIITLHDLIPYFHKTGKATTKSPLVYSLKHLFYKLLIGNAVKKAAAIITPSNSVKSEICSTFGQPYEKKIAVTYEGVDEKLMRVSENQQLQQQFSTDFFIYIGNFYPHKNVEKLIRAFSLLKSDAKLILLGPADFFSGRILQFINKLECDEKVIFFPNPTNEDLVFFYKHARALIHPSLAEGFGLPLIEAIYFHCPIIASNIPVFNELLGDNFLKFNPRDVNDIKAKIEQRISQPSQVHYQNITERFSFKQMAEKTFRLYESLTS